MQIQVGPGTGELHLEDPEVFTAFSVGLRTGAEHAWETLKSAGIHPDPERADHVWVPAELVPQLAGTLVDATWERSFEAMVGYARSHGWYAEDSASINAHLGPV